MDAAVFTRRKQQVFYDQKWKKFLAKSWLFRWVPFVTFVCGAGSLATGNVHPGSDFDVIVGAEPGRIFTARFFATAFFGVFGWRRHRLAHDDSAADKVCFNHFVTAVSYKLAPPYHSYWRYLYKNLALVFGSADSFRSFVAANESWAGKLPVYRDDLRHRYAQPALAAYMLERILRGECGERLERFLKRIQVRRIESSLRVVDSTYGPRIRYTDAELEFHPDTRRIKAFRGAGW